VNIEALLEAMLFVEGNIVKLKIPSPGERVAETRQTILW
jgi:hypothetical protein